MRESKSYQATNGKTSVTSVKIGDVVIPCYTPEFRSHDCIFCQSAETNFCPKIR